MKFAIRKLALACVVPTTMLVGMSTHVRAQDVSATSPTTAVMSAETTTLIQPAAEPPRLLPPRLLPRVTNAAPIRTPQVPQAANPQVGKPGTPAGTRAASSRNRIANAPIRQVANQVPQQQQPQPQQQPPAAGGETDVQKQLRLLYEKSGQEMPVMDINELVVPEPQPGVMPGTGVPAGAQPGMVQPGMQTPAESPKKPSFFERVFLGKKAPPTSPQPQQPQPGMQRPGTVAPPNGAIRPPAGQPGGNYQNPSSKGGPQNATNYRPYTPNPQAQPNTAGQRPGMVQPGGASNQRPNSQVQPRPQGYPAGQGATAVPVTQQPFLQPPQGAINQQTPAGQNSAGVEEQQQVAQPQATRKSDLPVLEDEPEESLEIDLTPRAPGTAVNRPPQAGAQQPAGRQNPAVQPNQARRVIPAPTSTTGSPNGPGVSGTAVTGPSAESNATTVPSDENPFSGLRLTIPDAAAQKPASSLSTPAVNPVSPPAINPMSPTNGNQPQANRPVRATPTTSPAVPQSADKATGGSSQPTLSKNGAHNIPAIPVSRQSAPGPEANPFLEPPVDRATSLSLLDDNLRKLAESPEKLGFKGFCPVMLRQHRTLAIAKPQFNASYQGKKYRFSSADAKAQFEKSPHLFAPAHNGADGVTLLDNDKSLEGSLDFAAWYQGRLYMFTKREHLEMFHAEPDQYMDEKDLDATLEKALGNPANQKPNSGSVANPTANRTGQKPGVGTPSKSAVDSPATKSPAGRPAAASSGQPRPRTSSGTGTRATRGVQAPTTDDLPVLADDMEIIEPIAPPANSNRAASPATAEPNANAGQSNPNRSVNPTPLKTTLPQTTLPQPVNSTAPKADKVKPADPQLPGPKLQGPKLSALIAPVKPASGVQAQQAYPAPKLINPPPKLIAPSAVQPDGAEKSF
ncbi:MAG: hypothetical protein JWM11_978 [Planctomycetaceae bacterium]|nr:hypothetical protein [Planctomycetaceae bacterium]